LFGFLGLTILTGHSLVDFWKQKLLVIVELNDQVEEESLNRLQQQLENAEYTVPGSLNIITKDEAAEMMRKDFGDDFLSADIPNPLHHVYTFNVNSAFSDTLSLENIRTELREFDAVYDVFYEPNLSQKVSRNTTNFLWYGIAMGILFIFVAVIIVRQSVIISISSAKSVLTDDTERWRLPTMTAFLIRNTKNALWSGALAVCGLIIVSFRMNSIFPEISEFLQNAQLVVFLIILLACTILTYTLTTWLVYLAILKKLKI
jgi:cell division transport system permease protein